MPRDAAYLLDMLLAAREAIEFAATVEDFSDLERVWETAQRDIPRLIESLAPLVPPDTN